MMTDHLGATAAQINVSLPPRHEPAPVSTGWHLLSTRIRALILAAWRTVGSRTQATLDRDAAFHARSERFDDPAIRRMIYHHRTAVELRQDFFLRQHFGPRLW